MSENIDSALTYTSYLAVDELLKLQRPLSTGPEHDEMLFIIIHQTYELWFKQLIHEFKEAQRAMESGDSHYSLAILGRIRTILKVCVTQIDILETMTPLQFESFRSYLSSSSGFQSAQFRMVEALLGRRDEKMAGHLHQIFRNKSKRSPLRTLCGILRLHILISVDIRFLPMFLIETRAPHMWQTKVCKMYCLKFIAKIQSLQWCASVS